MTIARIHIQPNYAVHGIDAYLVRHHDDGSFDTAEVNQFGSLEWTTHSADQAGMVHPATFRLSDNLGRELLDALADHYGGTNAVRGIREDYLHERGRVDRLITALITGGTR